MSVDAIRLRNFRGFHDVTLELKPLTVLLGPNSSGKSSFGHALSAMSHSHRRRTPSNRPSLSPVSRRDAEEWPVDFGLIEDLRSYGSSDRVHINLHTTGGWVEYGFGLRGEEEIRLSYVAHPLGVQISTANVASTDVLSPLRAETHTEGRLIASMTADEASLTTSFRIERTNERDWWHGNSQVAVAFNGLVLMAAAEIAATRGGEALLSGTARDEVRFLLENLTYLRATRERPMRGYLQGVGDCQPIGYSGEWTTSLLKRRGQDEVKNLFPPVIPGPTIVEASDIWESRSESLIRAVNAWLERIDLAGAVEIEASASEPDWLETKFKLTGGKAARNITEVGFGLSQVLPVIVAGLLLPVGSLLVVDLPEAHLHPRPQAALADFFCSLALSGRNVLIESHSELLFHRLRLWAAMNEEIMQRVAVYFLDPPVDGTCKQPRHVKLGFDDSLTWPPGFLQEAWETEAQIEAIRKRKARTSV
jgi:predicted ATPase